MASGRRVGAVAAATVLLVMVGSCGGSDTPAGGSPTPTNGDEPAGQVPSLGAACDKADAVVHLDATDSDARCELGSDGTLVWVDAGSPSGSSPDGGGDSVGLTSSDEIPAVIETFGFDLAPFDASSGMAGLMRITGVVPPKLPTNDPNAPALDARNEYLFLPFGYPEGTETDPQWAFYLPLGTPVISLITGTVCDVPKLYSNDYSIRVVPDGVECEHEGRAAMMFETEHVIDPLVAFGDHVTAGQRIATVSDYQTLWKDAGFGIVEIGVAYNLGNDGSPWHACPTRFFAPSMKDSMTSTLTSLMAAWSSELGRTDMYDRANDPLPGCFTADVHA